MSKLALVVLLPLLAVGALILAVLSLWSVERSPEAVQTPRQRAKQTPAYRWSVGTPTLARAA